MSIQELEKEVRQLHPAELKQLFQLIEQLQEEEWDRQIAMDIDAGRFDAIVQRINKNFDEGRCKPL